MAPPIGMMAASPVHRRAEDAMPLESPSAEFAEFGLAGANTDILDDEMPEGPPAMVIIMLVLGVVLAAAFLLSQFNRRRSRPEDEAMLLSGERSDAVFSKPGNGQGLRGRSFMLEFVMPYKRCGDPIHPPAPTQPTSQALGHRGDPRPATAQGGCVGGAGQVHRPARLGGRRALSAEGH